MPHTPEEKKELGRRLASARKLAAHTIDSAAAALTANGHKIGKAALGAWEVGRNVPDALWVKRLAKLYDTTADSLIWDNSLSAEAVKVASEYDQLGAEQKAAWNAHWRGFIAGAATGRQSEATDRRTDPRLAEHLREIDRPASEKSDRLKNQP